MITPAVATSSHEAENHRGEPTGNHSSSCSRDTEMLRDDALSISAISF